MYERNHLTISETSAISEKAGFLFGRFVARGYDNWTFNDCLEFAKGLTPVFPIVRPFYIKGFLEGAKLAIDARVTDGRDLPLVKKRKVLKMPKESIQEKIARLNATKRAVSGPKFITPRSLSAVSAIFSIHEIVDTTSQFGPQFTLTIKLRKDTLQELEDAQMTDFIPAKGQVCKTSFSKTPGRTPFFETLKLELPLFNAFVDNADTETGSEFFDLCFLEPDSPFYQTPPEIPEGDDNTVVPILKKKDLHARKPLTADDIES